MRDLLGWNISLGRWAGVHVRVHAFFVVFAVVAIHFGLALRAGFHLYAFAVLGVLFASVLVHELGHVLVAQRLGGNPEQVLLWPFGGLAPAQVAHDPRDELMVAVAGPAANLLVCLAMMPMIVAWTDWKNGGQLLDPLKPPVPQESLLAGGEAPTLKFAEPKFWAGLVFWVNWVLALANTLPTYPLDGGRVLRSVLWPKFGYRTAVLLVARIAKLTAVGLWIAAWLVRDSSPHAPLPLALLGIFVFFSAKQEAERLTERDAEDLGVGYDFSQGYTSLDKQFDPSPKRAIGPLRQWLDNRRAARDARQREIEAQEEQRVDDILIRLHMTGINGISEDDRALLDRVSARYRNRQRG